MFEFKGTTLESEYDERTIQHDMTSPAIYTKGGYEYVEHLHQHKVGICTAISLIQNLEKVTSKKYSYDFQYLLQKKFIDQNWIEGSSPFSALKASKKYGFLPKEGWLHTTEEDLSLPYSQYIEKLKAIPDSEITNLLKMCEFKLTGYAQVDISSKESVAQALDSSKSGLLCRYTVNERWWKDKDGNSTWEASKINPLDPNGKTVGGHQIILSGYDYTSSTFNVLSNTWGNDWCDKGNALVDFDNYKMTEAWIPYYGNNVEVTLTKDLKEGMQGGEVKFLQEKLKKLGFFPQTQICTGFFGSVTRVAVEKFQLQYKNEVLTPAGLTKPTGIVGKFTRNKLNTL